MSYWDPDQTPETVASSDLLLIAIGIWVTTALLSCAATALARRFAPKFGLLDMPDARKVHREPTPLGGGLAIWASVCGVVAVSYLAAAAARSGLIPEELVPDTVEPYIPGFLSRLPLVSAVLGAATVQAFLGLWDDWRGLSYGVRLFVEFALVMLLAWCGIRVTLFPPLNTPVISYLLTAFWIVGLTNAFNFLDNMDALSAGVATICSVFLATVALMIGDLFIAGFSLVLCGALCGFLWHNWPPARIFMGDAGSTFVGFLLGIVTVAGTFTTPDYPAVTILAPLCIMAVPIYDSVTVILIRLSEGRSPFLPDKRHFSHRLVELGLSPVRAVLTIYLATAATALSAIMLYFVPLRWAVVVLLQVLAVLGLVGILETTGLRGRRRTTGPSPSQPRGHAAESAPHEVANVDRS